MIFIESYVLYYILASIGITFGYHRYFAHNEIHPIFEYLITKAHPIVECVMLYCGILCGGQSALSWCGIHRMHHTYSDTPQDPHSPLYKKWYQILFSTWRIKNIPRKFVKDLYQNPRVMFFHKYRWHVYVCHLILITSLHFALFCDQYIISEWLMCLIFQLQLHAIIFVLSYIGYGTLNAFGHNHQGPNNRWWINLVAPLEGNHDDHHKASAR